MLQASRQQREEAEDGPSKYQRDWLAHTHSNGVGQHCPVPMGPSSDQQ